MRPLDGWVNGPNPFGNQRAQYNETWYRKTAKAVYEIRYDFDQRGFVVNKETVQSKATMLHPGVSRWNLFSPMAFDDPLGAMVWFELEDKK